MKHKNKNHQFRRIGQICLLIGLVFISISFILNFIFINDKFKKEYKEVKYKECMEKINSQEVCSKDYR